MNRWKGNARPWKRKGIGDRSRSDRLLECWSDGNHGQGVTQACVLAPLARSIFLVWYTPDKAYAHSAEKDEIVRTSQVHLILKYSNTPSRRKRVQIICENLRPVMIEGVVVKDLKQFVDDRGRVMHMLRADDALFEKFGEVYFSEVLPGVVKAWKKHRFMTQLFAVPVGMIRLVIYDDREGPATRGEVAVFETGREKYQLIRVPASVWYGFKCISKGPALLVNCSDLPHDPDEVENIDSAAAEIPHAWS